MPQGQTLKESPQAEAGTLRRDTERSRAELWHQSTMEGRQAGWASLPHVGRSHQLRQGSETEWKVLVTELRLTEQDVKEQKDGQELEAGHTRKVFSHASWEGRVRLLAEEGRPNRTANSKTSAPTSSYQVMNLY